MVEKKI